MFDRQLFVPTLEYAPASHSQSLEWFAVRVKPNCENKSSASLRARGYEVFLPVRRRLAKAKSRASEQLPLFPGYLFCRFAAQALVPVLSAAGVIHVVSFDGKPQALEAREVSALRVVSESCLTLQPWPRYEPGQTVEILEGPLSGIEGIVLRESSEFRLILSVSLLQRSVVAEVESSAVRVLRMPGPRDMPLREGSHV